MTVQELIRRDRKMGKSDAARLVRMLLTDYNLVELGQKAPGELAATRLAETFGYGPEVLALDVMTLVRAALDRPEILLVETPRRQALR